MPDAFIEAAYVAKEPDRDPEELAEAIAREQSLEILAELIPERIAERYLGRVTGVRALDDERWRLDIAYPAALASGQVGQLLQLLYGNVSYYPRIRLNALRLPETLLDRLPGPIGGVRQIRRWTGVEDRSLLATVLKPRGSAPDALADLAYRFAIGGGDLLKDDQNLVETGIEPFRRRVGACAAAVERAAEATGRRCLYLPHVAGSGAFLHRQLECVASLGLGGVVICPWIVGLETAATAAREFDLMWLAHPAAAGVFTEPEDRGIAGEVLFGQLARTAGADIVIFPGRGGRIQSSRDDTEAICDALTGPLGDLAPALPCAGGGKTLHEAPESAARLGPDFAVLVGGDLLRQSDLTGAVRSAIAALSDAP
jgi:ribulose-bisphosphate carboxylase large chain